MQSREVMADKSRSTIAFSMLTSSRGSGKGIAARAVSAAGGASALQSRGGVPADCIGKAEDDSYKSKTRWKKCLFKCLADVPL